MKSDTIAAIATGDSDAGIGIIRISGENAFSTAERIFRGRRKEKAGITDMPSHTAHYGYILDNGEIIDEVLLLIMKCPHSYTGEDTVEISCHGGFYVKKRILEAAVRNGARPAEPGEFSRRAFLNGKMDLTEAEAVMDIIHSRNDYALQSSLQQLSGRFSEKIKEIRKRILYHTAHIESALDDPEHISLDGYAPELKKEMEQIKEALQGLLDTFENGRLIKEGIRTVIVGKPNVGKSSLLNILSGSERAIVTDIPGTTRDTIEEQIRLGGILINLTDTAGIRNTENQIEKIGVIKARHHAEDCDLALYMMDASQPLDSDDLEIIKILKKQKTIVMLNKTDLETKVTKTDVEEFIKKNVADDPQITGTSPWPVIEVSMTEHQGLDELEKMIQSMFFSGCIDYNNETIITNVRHRNLLEDAEKSICQVLSSIRDGMPEDFFSIDLMDAYNTLGTITGETAKEDLIDEIFSKFCTGK